VRVKANNKNVTVLAGSADIFLPHFKNSQEKKWLEALVETNSPQGKHVLCVACLEGESVNLPKDLSAVSLSLVAVFIFQNNLRPGIREAIDFFQNRGVRIRIISGDNPETASAIANQAGIRDIDKAITGSEMASWSEADFDKQAPRYAIFSRIMPEQKEKIIEALKKDGFTAMIGDGANDALAVKKANLGIAMFEGAPATRQLASVVLMNNSFSALPGGVELADTIITNLEILASIFLNVSFVGLFFFIFISIWGFEFPLTPLNVTVIDYCTVGLPGLLIAYWSIRPSGKAGVTKDQPFLKRILPFTVLSAILEALSLVIIYWLSPNYLKLAQSNALVLIEFSIVGFIFCIYSFVYFQGKTTPTQKLQIFALTGLEAILLLVVFSTPLFANFFDLIRPNLNIYNILEILLVTGLFIFLQRYLVKRLILKK
jgi:cation-transporting ATPase E